MFFWNNKKIISCAVRKFEWKQQRNEYNLNFTILLQNIAQIALNYVQNVQISEKFQTL